MNREMVLKLNKIHDEITRMLMAVQASPEKIEKGRKIAEGLKTIPKETMDVCEKTLKEIESKMPKDALKDPIKNHEKIFAAFEGIDFTPMFKGLLVLNGVLQTIKVGFSLSMIARRLPSGSRELMTASVILSLAAAYYVIYVSNEELDNESGPIYEYYKWLNECLNRIVESARTFSPVDFFVAVCEYIAVGLIKSFALVIKIPLKYPLFLVLFAGSIGCSILAVQSMKNTLTSRFASS